LTCHLISSHQRDSSSWNDYPGRLRYMLKVVCKTKFISCCQKVATYPLAWPWKSEVGSAQHVTVACRQSFSETTYANSTHEVGEEPVSPRASSGPRDCASLGITLIQELHPRSGLSLMNTMCRRERWSSMRLPAGAADQLLGARFLRIEPVGSCQCSEGHNRLVLQGPRSNCLTLDS
jgi:hypothetical protein